MIRSFLFVVVATTAIGGCTNQDSAQSSVSVAIRPGMNYTQARAMLTSSGLKEIEVIWAIQPAENIENVFTFYLDDRSALLVFVERDSGEIGSMVRLDDTDRPRAFRKWTELDSFIVDVHGPPSNKMDTGDGE